MRWTSSQNFHVARFHLERDTIKIEIWMSVVADRWVAARKIQMWLRLPLKNFPDSVRLCRRLSISDEYNDIRFFVRHFSPNYPRPTVVSLTDCFIFLELTKTTARIPVKCVLECDGSEENQFQNQSINFHCVCGDDDAFRFLWNLTRSHTRAHTLRHTIPDIECDAMSDALSSSAAAAVVRVHSIAQDLQDDRSIECNHLTTATTFYVTFFLRFFCSVASLVHVADVCCAELPRVAWIIINNKFN